MSRLPQALDVTDVFDHYRLTSRDLWNRGFWAIKSIRPLTRLQTVFGSINRMLFETLVLERLAIDHEIFRNDEGWADALMVESTSPLFTLNVLQPRSNGGFDAERDCLVSATGVQMKFVEYFVWGYHGYVDIEHILVKIVLSKDTPELTNRYALIETRFAKIILL